MNETKILAKTHRLGQDRDYPKESTECPGCANCDDRLAIARDALGGSEPTATHCDGSGFMTAPRVGSGYTWPRILRPLERWWFHYQGRRELDRIARVAKQLKREAIEARVRS